MAAAQETSVSATSTPAATLAVPVATSTAFRVAAGEVIKKSLAKLTVASTEKTFIGNSAAVLTELEAPASEPWQINRLSSVYQVDFQNPKAFSTSSQLLIEIGGIKTTNNLKQLFYYDKRKDAWKPLPSAEVSSRKAVTAKLPFPYAKVAVFEVPGFLTVGKASWYKYKGGLFAASPDFPKGSRLRVFNLDNPKKFVDVVVNDFGPDRDRHPDRVIDLDKVAFGRIAPTGQGMARVRVEPLSIAAPTGQWLGQPAEGYPASMRIATKAGTVIDAKTGKTLWSKNPTSSMPIASLTKLVSAYVFLETKPSFNRVVPYSIADENYNYKFANKWEVARLKVSDGETMTIKDLFYSALVGSANNAVESLVRVSGLKRDDFIKRMNQVAHEWGASSAHFIEPTGLSPENVSSAEDYAIISTKTLSHPIIEEASKVKSYKFTTLNKKIPHTIKNSNQLITFSRLNVSGSKTGYLDEAGYCLLTRADDRRGKSVIVVTLGSPNRSTSFSETESLARYGLSLIK
ncbi:hypothetical protein HGA34_00940 [Candidatus Falkowbacteria bacterium]|nr:hypothetical protein [Candidatus Falkowbacteria bacterium]